LGKSLRRAATGRPAGSRGQAKVLTQIYARKWQASTTSLC
jgi:hypothetical protein